MTTPETAQNCAATASVSDTIDAASVSDTIDAINRAAKSRGGYHKDYSVSSNFSLSDGVVDKIRKDMRYIYMRYVNKMQ